MRKRITILTQYFAPEMGAPQSRLYELAKGLLNNGWEVMVVTAYPNYPTGKVFSKTEHDWKKNDELEGIKIHRYWLYPSNSQKAIPRIISMLSFTVTGFLSYFKLRKFKPDYILAESPPLTLGLTGLYLSKWTKAKMIFNVSDLWPLSAKELGAISDGKLYRNIEKLEHYLYRKADICTGQSNEILAHIEKYGAKDTFLFRNGVDIKRFELDIPYPNNATPKLVYAGLLGVAQGIAGICKNVNFKELGVEFHVYGAGKEQEELEEYLKKNPDNGIFYHGTVKRNEIPAMLQQHDGTIIPLVKHLYGAVPSKIYEAMAAGLPILFCSQGEGGEIIRSNDVGYVSEALDYDGLKANIKKFAEDGETRNRMHLNCIKTAKEKFDRNKVIANLSKYLEERA